MKFQREGKKTIENASEAQIRKQLSYKTISAAKIAILESLDGSYIQVYGGGYTCCLEWRDLNTKKHFRAFIDPPIVPWTEHATIGELRLAPRECLPIKLVIECFCCFLKSMQFPEEVKWRDITDGLISYGISPPK